MKPKFEIGEELADTIQLLIVAISGMCLLFTCSCHTPSITIYQQGVSVGNGTIVVRETKHLQQVETIYEGKGKVGAKVIVRSELW